MDLAAPLAAALAVALILPAGASAHVSLVPTRTEASTPVTLTFVAPGEHELAMVAFRVRLPPGLTVLEGGQPGWRFAVENGAAIWNGGRVTPYGTASFRLRVRSPAEGGVHQLVAVQRYADGHADRWTVPLAVAEASPGQNLLAAAIVGAVGLTLVLALILLRGRRRH
jgi:hypothetical protein